MNGTAPASPQPAKPGHSTSEGVAPPTTAPAAGQVAAIRTGHCQCGDIAYQVAGDPIDPHLVAYTREQDDFCVHVMHLAAARHLGEHPEATVVLDGRTCSRRYQVEDVQRLAEETGRPLRIIECVCPDDGAAARLHKDVQTGTHPAANRDLDLHRRVAEFTVHGTFGRYDGSCLSEDSTRCVIIARRA
ncbi:AAA family ATPase [Streptomyces lydicus]